MLKWQLLVVISSLWLAKPEPPGEYIERSKKPGFREQELFFIGGALWEELGRWMGVNQVNESMNHSK